MSEKSKRARRLDKLKIDLPFEDALGAALEIAPMTKKTRTGRARANLREAEGQRSQRAGPQEGQTS